MGTLYLALPCQSRGRTLWDAVAFGFSCYVGDETVDKKQLEERLRKEAILALFADRKMPAGRASRELGLTRIEFMELCRKRDIPLYDYTLDDFEQDVKTIDKLWPEIERNVRESGGGGLK